MPPPAVVLMVELTAPMAEAAARPEAPPQPTAPAEPAEPVEPVEPPTVLQAAEPPSAVPAPVSVPRRPKPKAAPWPNPPSVAAPAPPTVAEVRGTAAPAKAPPAAPAAAAPPRQAATPSNAVARWQGALLGRLDRYKRYPRAARRQGQEGIAHLRLVIDRQGLVLAASLATPSGFTLLDDEVLALARRAEPLPPPPDDVAGATIELVLPVAFQLH